MGHDLKGYKSFNPKHRHISSCGQAQNHYQKRNQNASAGFCQGQVVPKHASCFQNSHRYRRDHHQQSHLTHPSMPTQNASSNIIQTTTTNWSKVTVHAHNFHKMISWLLWTATSLYPNEIITSCKLIMPSNTHNKAPQVYQSIINKEHKSKQFQIDKEVIHRWSCHDQIQSV